MAMRTAATNWVLISKDDTGTFVNIDYKCPNCHFDTGEMIFIGGGNLDKIDSSFETDQVCGICNKDLIIECRK